MREPNVTPDLEEMFFCSHALGWPHLDLRFNSASLSCDCDGCDCCCAAGGSLTFVAATLALMEASAAARAAACAAGTPPGAWDGRLLL